jgi:peptide deformylase
MFYLSLGRFSFGDTPGRRGWDGWPRRPRSPLPYPRRYGSGVPDDFIRQWGDPVLYERADPITVFDDLLRVRAARLCRRLELADGAGLAATQVGWLRRVFAFRLSREHAAAVMVNPRVVWRSEQLETFLEGCLSFNTVAVAVRRPFAVRVVGCDVKGDPVELECEDFGASLIQHEIDHLDGVLTLRRADPAERRRATNSLLSNASADASLAA